MIRKLIVVLFVLHFMHMAMTGIALLVVGPRPLGLVVAVYSVLPLIGSIALARGRGGRS